MGKELWQAYFRSQLEQFGPSFHALGWSRRGCLLPYLVLREAGIRSWDTVLDIGCGLGFGLYALPDVKYTGVDVVPEMIVEARKIHNTASRASMAQFYVGGADQFERECVTFDWVLCAGIFNIGYTWPEVEEVVRQGWRLCKEGLGVTFLRKVPKEKMEDAQSQFPADLWISLAEELTPFWQLRTDFLPNQASLVLYRKGARDVR